MTIRQSDAAVDYITRQVKVGKPFFCWYNSVCMHLRTHVKADRRSPPGLTARTEYADGMVEHDGHVGKLLIGPGEARRIENGSVHAHPPIVPPFGGADACHAAEADADTTRHRRFQR